MMPRKPKHSLQAAIRKPKAKPGKRLPTAMTDAQLDSLRSEIVIALKDLIFRSRFEMPELTEFDIPEDAQAKLKRLDAQRIKAAYASKPVKAPKPAAVKIPADLKKKLALYAQAVQERPAGRAENVIVLISPEGNRILVEPVASEVDRYIEAGYIPEMSA